MRMMLTGEDLVKIAGELHKLRELSAEITSMRVNGHTVHLKREDSQMNGTTYYIVGMTNRTERDNPPGREQLRS